MDGNDRHYGVRSVFVKDIARLDRTAVSTAVFLLAPLLAATLLAVLLMLLVIQSGSAQGGCLDEVSVTSGANSGPGSLRQALLDVCPGGVVRLDGLAGQTVTLSSTLVISRSVQISGSGGEDAPVVSGGGSVRVLEVRGRELQVSLDGLTVADGLVSDQAICQLFYFQRIFCGAGMLINPGNFVTVTNTTFRDNHVAGGVGRGAGILSLSSQLTLRDNRFENNRTDQNLGGAVYIEGGVLRVERSQFINNQAESGAGIFSGQSGMFVPMVSVSDSLFSGNQVTAHGAGISLGNGTLSVRGSTFDHNQADHGAGLYINGLASSAGSQAAIIENNTFNDNQGLSGVGMQLYSQELVVRNNTLVGNQAAPGRAAVEILPSPSVTFENNLLSGNSSDCRLMSEQTITSRNNLFASPGELVCGAADNVNGNQLGRPAYVGALGDYGGLTPTIPLLPGSPAIDAGDNCTAQDQRGVDRPLPEGGACDIGAFESHGFHLVLLTGDNQVTPVTRTFPFPLVIGVVAVDPIEPVDGGVVNYDLPTSGASATLDSNPVTIAGGQAAPVATANAISAGYQAQAHTAGAPERLVFNLFNSFQELIFDQNPNNPSEQWSDTRTTTSPCGTTFLGEFSNQTVTLNLENLPPHAQALVTFDLYILRSWDGNQVNNTPALREIMGGEAPDLVVGPDRWQFQAAGVTLLDTTFTNWVELNFRQAFPGSFGQGDYPAQTGATTVNSLCYTYGTRLQDAVYQMAYFINHSGPSLQLDFTGSGLQSLQDESWGLANVRVTVANPGFRQLFSPVMVAAP